MTLTAGYVRKVAPCCGANYRVLHYRSVNYMAWSHWTDGYREQSLMPNDRGLRQCKCGNYYMLRELLEIGRTEDEEIPVPVHVEPTDLPHAIANARTNEIAIAARIDYWQHLNHSYRDQYRAHRDAEDEATKKKWEESTRAQTPWWKALVRGWKPHTYVPSPDRPVTFPDFVPTTDQVQNMSGLLELLGVHSDPLRYALEIVELHRELGQFDQAREALATVPAENHQATCRLQRELIEENCISPLRYRM